MFPMVIRNGSVQVKIYHCRTKKGYDAYYVVYYLDGVRKMSSFAHFDKAKKEAEFVAQRMGSAEADVLVLKSADRAAYQLARRILDPLGVSVEEAALQFAHATKRLGKVRLTEAVEFYLRWRPTEPELRSVEKVVAEFLETKDRGTASEVYAKALRYALTKFSARFKGNIHEVSGREIDVWLREVGVAARTQNNMRAAICSLFKFAKSRKYLPKDHDELEAVPVAKAPPAEIRIFTPAEMVEILCHTPPRLIPFMVLGAFAGVRHAEILRLDWKELRIEEGHLVVGAAKAKTASRRVVPVLENLREWLSQSRPTEGRVCELVNMVNEIHDTVLRINKARKATWEKGRTAPESTPQSGEGNTGEEFQPFVWKQNGLRHSFVSYRVAQIQNVDQVALEAGTSREMVFKNYRALVTSASAKERFSITPAVVERAQQQLCPASAAHDEPSVGQVTGQVVEDGGRGSDR